MSKELTEKWKNNTLEKGWYYISCYNDWKGSVFQAIAWACDGTIALPVQEVIAPVPSYRDLYGENDGNMPTGVFTVLKIIKENIDITQKQRRLTNLECGIKSQVVSLLKKWGVK